MNSDQESMSVFLNLLEQNELMDLELCLQDQEDIFSVLGALSNNYLIRNITLKCYCEIDEYLVKEIQEFESKRLSTRVILISEKEVNWPIVEPPFKISYPI